MPDVHLELRSRFSDAGSTWSRLLGGDDMTPFFVDTQPWMSLKKQRQTFWPFWPAVFAGEYGDWPVGIRKLGCKLPLSLCLVRLKGVLQTSPFGFSEGCFLLRYGLLAGWLAGWLVGGRADWLAGRVLAAPYLDLWLLMGSCSGWFQAGLNLTEAGSLVGLAIILDSASYHPCCCWAGSAGRALLL